MISTMDFLHVLSGSSGPVSYNKSFGMTYLNGLRGRSTGIMADARYIAGYPSAEFVQVGTAFLNSYGTRGGELDLFLNNVPHQNLVLEYLGQLVSGVCIGFDYTTPSAQATGVPEVSYFTACANVMTRLLAANAFADKAKATKSMDALFGGDHKKSDLGNKFSASFKRGSIPLIRLDIKQVTAKGVLLDAVIPQKFPAGFGAEFVLWPVPTYVAVGDGLMDLLQTGAFELVSQTYNETGELKTRLVTSSGSFVISYYETLRDKHPDPRGFSSLVSAHLGKAEAAGFGLGFLPMKKQWYVFNLRSSLHGSPVSTLRPELIVSLKQVPDVFAGLNLDDLTLSPDATRRLFERRVRSWSRATASAVIPDSAQLPNLKQAREYVLGLFKDAESDQLIAFMRAHPDAFCSGDVDPAEALSKVNASLVRETASLVRLTSGMTKAFSADGDAVCDPGWLGRLLQKGPVKIVARSKRTGSRREYICTRNADLLEKTYKPLRYLGYESPGKALAELISMVRSGEITSENSFLNRANAAGVDGMLDLASLNTSSTPADYVRILQEAKAEYEAEQADKDRKPMDPNVVSFRSLLATYRGNYFGSVDVMNVIEVWA